MTDENPQYKLMRMLGFDWRENNIVYSASEVAEMAFDDRNTAYEKLMTCEVGVRVTDDDGDVWERVS